MNNSQGRCEYLDVYKGIGIILMIIGHVGFGEKIAIFISSFHMPMFYVVAGIFFKDRPLKDLLKRKAKSMLMPYIVFGLLHYIFWIVLSRGNYDVSVFEPLLNLFWINTVNLPIAGALWFLTSLFFCEAIYLILHKSSGGGVDTCNSIRLFYFGVRTAYIN